MSKRGGTRADRSDAGRAVAAAPGQASTRCPLSITTIPWSETATRSRSRVGSTPIAVPSGTPHVPAEDGVADDVCRPISTPFGTEPRTFAPGCTRAFGGPPPASPVTSDALD
ncbi:hypothetical protein EF879_08585 [Micromonospora sp. HM5-17]|nr:hypothetical protein EF879_08585 [Micromonospora sp. HM5-17]